MEALGATFGSARVRWTGRAHGHLGLPHEGADDAALRARRAGVVNLPWTWVHQVHGTHVVTVRRPGDQAGVDGDGLVTACPSAVLAVFTADCAPVAFISPEGVIGLAHAGWRGLAGGVLARTVEAMVALGASHVDAILGPCIRAGCYEFGAADLDRVAAALGDTVRSRTGWDAPSLDLPAAVRAGLDAAGARLVLDVGACTACSGAWFSHRARADTSRQATVVWLAGEGDPTSGPTP